MIKDMGLGWILLLLISILLAMMFMFASPQAVKSARAEEDRNVRKLLGDQVAEGASAFAQRNFGKHFIDSGIVGQVQAMYIPSDENRAKSKGFENFLPEFFRWWQLRLEGFWQMIYGSYKRFYILGIAFPYCLPLLVPCLISGLIGRQNSIEDNDVGKPVYFHGAKKALYWLLAAPFFVLFWPLAINSGIWIAWLWLVPITIWMTSRHVQEL